ncbi:MAG TPA: Hsp20/alpha crystallin family protein [Candidatus Nitrosotenuis sp.]|nr:Hsp20/alpha crystallin family protein [Candidatus Nitrosotenuis sp.]
MLSTLTEPRALARREWLLEPWAEFERIRNAMNEIFMDLFPRLPGTPVPTYTWHPRVNLYKDKDTLVLEAALPGIDKKDVNVHVTPDTVTVHGEVKHEAKVEEKDLFCREMAYGSFSRTLRLPMEVDPSRTRATFDKGILKVTMPLVEPRRHEGTQIKIE